MGPGAGPDAPVPAPKPMPAPDGPPAHGQHRLACPLCGCAEFRQESGSLDSDFGMTAHRVDIMICQSCSYVMLFGKGRSFWWNVD
jgi:hypothetical protein